MAQDSIGRFIRAQEYDYNRALAEIRSGRKRSHWIWYIFPQVQGLGRSAMCQRYGIHGLEEAREYLANPLLSQRLSEISHALLNLDTSDPVSVLGGVDAMKVRSCMTLFSLVEGSDPVFKQVLNKYYGGKPDEATLRILEIDERCSLSN